MLCTCRAWQLRRVQGGAAAGLQQAVVEVHDDEAAVRVDLPHLPLLRRPPHPVLQVGPRPRPELLCGHPTCAPSPPDERPQCSCSSCVLLLLVDQLDRHAAHLLGLHFDSAGGVVRQHGLHRPDTLPQMCNRSGKGWCAAPLQELRKPCLFPWCARSVLQPLAESTSVERPCKGAEHAGGLTPCRVPFQHAEHVSLCGQKYEILLLALQPPCTLSSDSQPHATVSNVRRSCSGTTVCAQQHRAQSRFSGPAPRQGTLSSSGGSLTGGLNSCSTAMRPYIGTSAMPCSQDRQTEGEMCKYQHLRSLALLRSTALRNSKASVMQQTLRPSSVSVQISSLVCFL